ncbi:MAG: glycosyltransferase family 1 protein [Bacteroidota bacterium]
MKIGFDVSQTGNSKAGCGFYADTLVRHLIPQYSTDHFFLYPTFGNTYWDPNHHKSIGKLEFSNCYYPIRFKTREDSFNYWSSLKGLDEERIGSPDIIHANNFSSPRLQKSKLVYTVYDLSFIDVPECTTEENRHLCFNGMFRASILADMVIAISHHTKKRFLDNFPHFPSERVVVAHLGNRLPVEGVEEPVSSIPQSEPFFLAVGTLEPRKNLRRLLQAYRRYLEQSEAPKSIVLAGANGWLETDLAEYIESLKLTNNVHILGYVSDATLRWLYRSCWAFIYPSIYEGFGLPVLEAMAAGAATIISNATSLPEIGGNAVLYVDPLDKESIAASLVKIDDETCRHHLQSKCYQQAKNFAWSTTASVVYHAYEAAIKMPYFHQPSLSML